MVGEWIWCVACGATIAPDYKGDYLYCDECEDGPFCVACANEHECEEEDDGHD
jgi:hypothetical protein